MQIKELPQNLNHNQKATILELKSIPSSMQDNDECGNKIEQDELEVKMFRCAKHVEKSCHVTMVGAWQQSIVICDEVL